MNQEEKIEILKRQKKQIEEEIKRLKGVDLIEGRAKLSKDLSSLKSKLEREVSHEE